MSNRVIKRSDLIHCDAVSSYDNSNVYSEVDKTKSISELSSSELQKLINRLRSEREAEDIIRYLRRSAGDKDTYENPFKIDTKTPVDQLYHHGILGQKWGIRRFQNRDGTRTAAGKKRDASKLDQEQASKNKKSSVRDLSNEELRKINERLQLEATYKKLTTEKVEKSESFVKKALKSGGEQALTDFTKSVFLGSAKLLVKNFSPTFAEIAFKVKDEKSKENKK